MHEHPLVSIITVCLNAEKTIEETINSVISQSYCHIEYIIIDGASTDTTLEIIGKHKEHISILVSEPDSGLYNAMNKGIKLATGELIGILNADDIYFPTAIETVVEEYNRHKEGDAFCGNLMITIEQTKFERIFKPEIDCKKRNISIPHPSSIISKSCYLKYGLYDESYKIAADYDFFLRIALNGSKIRVIDQVLAHMANGGVSSKASLKKLAEPFRIRKVHHGIFYAFYYLAIEIYTQYLFIKFKEEIIPVIGEKRYYKISKMYHQIFNPKWIIT